MHIRKIPTTHSLFSTAHFVSENTLFLTLFDDKLNWFTDEKNIYCGSFKIIN